MPLSSCISKISGFQNFGIYPKVPSSRLVYYSILDSFGQRSQYTQASKFPFSNSLKILECATNQDSLLLATLAQSRNSYHILPQHTVFLSPFSFCDIFHEYHNMCNNQVHICMYIAEMVQNFSKEKMFLHHYCFTPHKMFLLFTIVTKG